MLIGNAVHSLDTKGRVVIPVKYREDLGSTIFALISVDGCIRLYPHEQFLQVIKKVREGDVTKNNYRRKVMGSVEQLSLDAQGRILLSEDLKKRASITDKVRMVGMIDWLELWNEDNLEQISDNLSQEDELMFMAELGLA